MFKAIKNKIIGVKNAYLYRKQYIFVTALMVLCLLILLNIVTTNQKIQNAGTIIEDLNKSQLELKLKIVEEQIRSEYYKSDAFRELEQRRVYGKAAPGEKVYELSDGIIKRNTPASKEPKTNAKKKSNLQKWADFYFSR